MAKNYRKPKTSMVKEAAVSYLKNQTPKHNLKIAARASRSMPETNIIHWLGGASLMMPINSEFDLITVGEKGVSKASIDELGNYLGISRKSLAEDIFDLSVKTLERKGAKEKLDKRTSAHALEIAKVLQHAFEVFEDEEKVKRWINKEHKALNGLKPVALFSTLTGLNMVNDILGRIEEGVYS